MKLVLVLALLALLLILVWLYKLGSSASVVVYHSWSRYVKGEHVRSYAYLGERVETQLDLAAQTPEKEELRFRFFEERSPDASQDDHWEREVNPDESAPWRSTSLVAASAR